MLKEIHDQFPDFIVGEHAKRKKTNDAQLVTIIHIHKLINIHEAGIVRQWFHNWYNSGYVYFSICF